MDTFIHHEGLSLIEKDGQRLEAFLKPEFSFQYDAIQFHESTKTFIFEDVETQLSELQIIELNDYIDAQTVNPQTQINFDAIEYLASTDWYAIRFAETGVVIPAEVTTKRAAARLSIIIEAGASLN